VAKYVQLYRRSEERSGANLSLEQSEEAMSVPVLSFIQNVRKLTTKILKVVPLTKSKTKMSDDKMPFDASISSTTFLNLKNVAMSHF
jgi:hypothetical protein